MTQHRKNRFNPEDESHVAVMLEPEHYTRASRRSAGIRVGAHTEAMREFHGMNRVLPRAVRRLFRDAGLAQVRVKRNRAKVRRLLAPYGVSL